MTTFPILKNVIDILMESTPAEIDNNYYCSRLLSISGKLNELLTSKFTQKNHKFKKL